MDVPMVVGQGNITHEGAAQGQTGAADVPGIIEEPLTQEDGTGDMQDISREVLESVGMPGIIHEGTGRMGEGPTQEHARLRFYVSTPVYFFSKAK